VQTPHPVVNWRQVRKLLSAHFANLPPGRIIEAINNGLKNDFVLQSGYSLATMLSASVLNGLLNSAGLMPRHRHRIASDAVADAGKYIARGDPFAEEGGDGD